MKLGNKMVFGAMAIVAGQKSTTLNAEPQLVANSTLGKFMITSPVSKALNIAVGENVMFLSNLTNVENAIAQRVDIIVNWCEENGVDINTAGGVAAVMAEFGQWYIAKGEAMYDAKGNPQMTSIRLTKEEKQAYIDAHVADYMANEEARAELARRCEEAGIEATEENMIAALTVDDVQAPQIPAFSGSKTANTGTATGVGCQLTFTDTAIWNSLKSDLGENKQKKNRIFSVDLDNPCPGKFANGCKEVDITMYPISFVEDNDPVVRTKKDASSDEAAKAAE